MNDGIKGGLNPNVPLDKIVMDLLEKYPILKDLDFLQKYPAIIGVTAFLDGVGSKTKAYEELGIKTTEEYIMLVRLENEKAIELYQEITKIFRWT